MEGARLERILVIVLIVLALLCMPAFGQTAAKDLLARGNVLYDQGNYEAAFQSYSNATELDPNNTEAWNRKGLSLYQLARYDEAVVAYDRAIKLDPKNASYWHNEGNALSDPAKYEEAIKAYDQAIRLRSQKLYRCLDQ